MFKSLLLMLISAILFMSSDSSAQEVRASTGETNAVDIVILRDGKIVGTPKLIMQVGSTAVLTVAKANGYSIKGSLSRDARIDNGRKVDIELYFAENGRWKLASKPNISAQLNRSGRITSTIDNGETLEIRLGVSDKFSGNISMQSWGQNKCSAKKIAEWADMMDSPVNFQVVKAGQFSDKPNNCCTSGNMTCCSDGPVCCGSGDGQSCCT